MMMRFTTRPLQLSAVAVCAVLGACGKGTTTEPKVATQLVITAGGGQVAAAGSALPAKIVVSARDAQYGAVSGVVVSATTEAQGGGSVSPTPVTTNANGDALLTWTLGSKVGAQILTVSSSGLPSVTVPATGEIGPATTIIPVSDAFQFAVVSRVATIAPSVRITDAFGNPVSGVGIAFDAPVPGSVLTGTTSVTNPSGVATLGTWTIGPDAISYSVRATVTTGPASGQGTVFEARGVPATAIAVEGIAQTANAGTAVAVPPGIRAARDDGSPLSGVAVTFTVTSGGGTIQGASGITGSDGIARATGWVLGPTPGANQVSATVAGVPSVSFTATGVLGVATSMVATSPTTQSGFFGNFTQTSPSVVVNDAQGRPVAGASVTFELLQADGQIVGATQLSNSVGAAILGGWRLGSTASQAVRAVLTGAPPVAFTANATAVPPSTFNVEVRYRTVADGCAACQVPSVAQKAAFDLAVARWKQMIISGQQPYPVNEASNSCFPAMNETVDGLVISARLEPIDGVNGVLGSAGPCIVRDDHGFQPVVGVMRFDTADLIALEGRNQLNDVILHEMAHVLGFGTMWDFDPRPFELIPIGPNNPINSLLVGRGTSDPVFIGTSTRAAFLSAVAVGRTFTGVPVPLANSGGPGTADSHWREPILDPELMTGHISATGTLNPLSPMTITTFRDLGYVVNDALGDGFTFQALLQAAAAPFPSFGTDFQLNEVPLQDPIIVIDRRGRTVARVPRTLK